MIKENTAIFGDCLNIVPKISSKSIDMALCNLPYCITKIVGIELFLLIYYVRNMVCQKYGRIVKDHEIAVLTANKPNTLAEQILKLYK